MWNSAGIFFRPGRASMPGIYVVWDAARDERLRAAVRVHGRRWGLVAVAVGGGCSNRAARDRWGRGRVAHVGVGLPSMCAQALVSLGGAVPMLSLPSLPSNLPGRSVAGVRGLGRSALFNRPWDYVVKKGLGCGSKVRSPTPRQSRLIAAWKLGVAADGHRLLLCNLSRAESIMRRHLASAGGALNDAVLCTCISVELRDSLSMVYYPGEVCHTVTTDAHLSWVGGTDGGRFVTAQETAAFMGHSSRGGFNQARSVFGECGAQMRVAESVHSRVADHIGGMVHALTPGPFATLGTLYSGCFDELGRGVSRVLGPLSCIFLAESDADKRRVLESEVSPIHSFADVSEVKGLTLPVDVLCVTPPCVDVSQKRRAFNRLGGEAIDLKARGAVSVSEHLVAVTEAVRSSSPSVIVIEQSTGLASHHPEAYQSFNSGLSRLPYVFCHGSVEASVVCGASHARDRLVWIGTRDP